jgi:hypothetical protein
LHHFADRVLVHHTLRARVAEVIDHGLHSLVPVTVRGESKYHVMRADGIGQESNELGGYNWFSLCKDKELGRRVRPDRRVVLTGGCCHIVGMYSEIASKILDCR